MKKLFYPWVMILFITTSACSQSTNDTDEAILFSQNLATASGTYSKTGIRIWCRWKL
jgi:hypothetical protein